MDRILIFLVIFIGSCGSPKADVRSLHIIGVYDGFGAQNRGSASKKVVKIEMNTPDEVVTLVLTSFEPVEWEINGLSEDQFESVILGGDGATSSAVRLNGEDFSEFVVNTELPFIDAQEGIFFRRLVEVLPRDLGFEKISSISTSYEAPNVGFRVQESATEPEIWRSDYLDAYVADVSNLAEIEFRANISGDWCYYSLDIQCRDVVHPEVPNRVIVSSENIFFDLENRKLIQTDSLTGDRSVVLQPPGLPNREWHPTSVLANLEDREILVSSWSAWDKNAIHAFDLESRSWREVVDLGRYRPLSMYLLDANGSLIFTASHLEKGDSVSLVTISPAGSVNEVKTFSLEDLPGFSDLFDVGSSPPPDCQVLFADEQFIVFSTDGLGLFDRQKQRMPAERIYLYEMSSAKVHLLYYKKDELDPPITWTIAQ